MKWELKQLGEVCDIQNGFAFKSKDYTESGARVIRIGNVQKGVIGDKSPRFIPLDRLKEFSRFEIHENDILISLTGDVGRVGQFPNHLLPALLNQRVGRFEKIDFASVNVGFLFHVLNSDWFEKEVIKSSEGAAQMNTSTKKIKAILIPIPPLAEQERIVEVLDDAFAAIDKAKTNIEHNLTNARELFQSRLNDIFSNLSEDWDVKLLGEVCDVEWGNTSLTKKAFVENGKYLAVSAAGMDGRIDHSEHAAMIPVISAIGANCGRMFLPEEPFTAVKNTMTVTPHLGLDSRFVFFGLSSIELPRRGAAQPFLALGDIRKIPFQIPHLEEQERVVRELDSLDDMKRGLETKYQTELDNLEELRQSILEQAFEGKLTEPVAA